MTLPDLSADLQAKLPRLRGRLSSGTKLADITWFRVGGPAQALFSPADEADLAYFLAGIPRDLPVTVIGLGSNLLVRDGGVRGVVIRIGKGFASITPEPGNRIRAGTAVPDVKVARAAADAGISGLAFYRGIPGSIGGALRMNAGAHGRETKDALIEARAVDRSGEIHVLKDDGSLIVTSREEADPRALAGKSVAPAVPRGEQGTPVEFTNAYGEQVIGSMRHVTGLDWLVVAEIPTTEVFRQLHRLRNITLLIVTAMLLAAGAMGYALGIFIVRPLDRLTRGAAKVAAGDLDVDLQVAEGGEVAYLTEVFNDMVARLRSSRQELERIHAEHAAQVAHALYDVTAAQEMLGGSPRELPRLQHACSLGRLTEDTRGFL